jgi:hypothetical protein
MQQLQQMVIKNKNVVTAAIKVIKITTVINHHRNVLYIKNFIKASVGLVLEERKITTTMVIIKIKIKIKTSSPVKMQNK